MCAKPPSPAELLCRPLPSPVCAVTSYRDPGRALTHPATPLSLQFDPMCELNFLSISEITQGLRAKKFRAQDLVAAQLKNIARLQPLLNAFTHIDEAGAMAQAQAVDAALGPGTGLGPLHGVPVTIKSSIDVAGWPCPAGSHLRENYLAAADAPVAARLKSAGAIVLGNTNTPEYLMSYETANALQGHTSNPWNLAHSSGGSSGGEASAITAGCSVAGVGSDGGGSIRVPAHFCGICGLKPTPGRIPATGHFPPGEGAFSWLGVVGPMARTVADLRAVFDVLRGPDPGDALSTPVAPQSPTPETLRGMRIGLLETSVFGRQSSETCAAIQAAADALTECGFLVEPFRLPELPRALELWWFFFGPAIAHLFRPTIGRDQKSRLSTQFREYLTVAQASPAPTLDSVLTNCAERDRVRAGILRQMAGVPVLLCPVSNTTAFRHNEGTWEGAGSYRDTMRASQWVNLVGFPALSIPMHFSAEGLPIGVQLIARPNEEELLLEVAAALERARGTWPNPKI